MALPQLIFALHGKIEFVLRRLMRFLNEAMKQHDCIIFNAENDPPNAVAKA
jgi:hypothetical protein